LLRFTGGNLIGICNQSIKLQWFKELIIQPKLNDINIFYQNLHSLKEKISESDLTEKQKIELINFIKEEQKKLKTSFVDLLQSITPTIHQKIYFNLDKLTDCLTIAISNDELKLNNIKTFEKEIELPIKVSHNYILTVLYNFQGE